MKAPRELVVAKENVDCKEFILFLRYLLGMKMVVVGGDVPSLNVEEIRTGKGAFFFFFFSFHPTQSN